MNKISFSSKVLCPGFLVGSLLGAIGYGSFADAAQGCGHGYHRGAGVGCVLNHPGAYSKPAPYDPGAGEMLGVNYAAIDKLLALPYMRQG